MSVPTHAISGGGGHCYRGRGFWEDWRTARESGRLAGTVAEQRERRGLKAPHGSQHYRYTLSYQALACASTGQYGNLT